MVLLALALDMHVASAGVSCIDPRVDVHGDVDARWLPALVDACEALARMTDGDPTARVRVAGDGRDLVVEVRLADGRGALRRVRAPADLRATLEALLVVPPAPPKPEAPPVAVAPAGLPATLPADPKLPVEPSSRPSLLVGASISARFASSPAQLFVGGAGSADLFIHRFVVGVMVRWDAYGRLGSSDPRYKGYEADAVALGLSCGRTIAQGVDLGGRASLVVEGRSVETSNGEVTSQTTDARIGAYGRWMPGRSQKWFVVVDGEVSPTRLRRTLVVHDALLALPAFGVGLAFGAAWEGG